MADNRAVIDDLRALETEPAQSGLVDDDAMFAFYDRAVGPDVVSARHFDRWWKQQRRADPDLLTMTRDDPARHHRRATSTPSPSSWHQHDLVLGLVVPLRARRSRRRRDRARAARRAQPGDAPTGFDWQVPGLRDDLVAALVRTLPKDYRRELVPLNDMIDATIARLHAPTAHSSTSWPSPSPRSRGVIVPPELFDPDRVPPHLRVTFEVVDADGHPSGRSKDLDDAATKLNPQLRRGGRRGVAHPRTVGHHHLGRRGHCPTCSSTASTATWCAGTRRSSTTATACRCASSPTADCRSRVMRTGVRRLLLLAVPVGRRAVEAKLTNALGWHVAGGRAGSLDDLVDDCTTAAADRCSPSWTGRHGSRGRFERLVRTARDELADSRCRPRCAQRPQPRSPRRRDRAATRPVRCAPVRRLGRRHRGPAAPAGPTRLRHRHRRPAGSTTCCATSARHRPSTRQAARRPGARDQRRLRDVVTLERRYAELLDRLERVRSPPR